MKTILAFSLIAVTLAQPWGYHHSTYGPVYYAGSHLTPTVYNTYYPSYYYPYAWGYGVNVAHPVQKAEAVFNKKPTVPVYQFKEYVLKSSSRV